MCRRQPKQQTKTPPPPPTNRNRSVPIPGSAKQKSAVSRFSRSSGPATCSIYDCLSEFMKEEVLDGDEKPTCEKCKKRQRCIKRLSLQRLPNTLVLHIKRFAFMTRSRAKITTNVKYPLIDLSLSDYLDKATTSSEHHGARYSLFAVSNHSGGQ